MKQLKIPSELKKMNEIFLRGGFEAYLVGGAVRDMLRGKPAADWDIATNASPEQVMRLFRRVIPTGIAHGTVTVHFMKHSVEVTTYRTESGYSDGRHPDEIHYASRIEDDLSRRDFTMNAVAVSLSTGAVVDPFGGKKDIAGRCIRTVGNPGDRFEEDGLRPVRAIRFAAQLGFKIAPETLAAIPAAVRRTAGISVERFRDEFIKMMEAPIPSQALQLLEKTGILKVFIPELASCRNVEQADCRGFHQFDVLDHLYYACDGAPRRNLTVRLAALFHDIGKPAVKRTEIRNGQQIYTFYNHEMESAVICDTILTRLRFPKAQIAAVCHLVRNHMFHYEPNWTDAAVRRFIVRVQPECIDDLFDLRIADVYGMTAVPPRLKDGPWSANLVELRDRINRELSRQSVLGLKDLAVNGKDLMNAGIPAGKTLGYILKKLLDAVLEDPSQNKREKLLEIACNMCKK